jgi:hypothetical protein
LPAGRFGFFLLTLMKGSADAISGFVFFGFGNLVGVTKTNPWPNVLFNSGFACSRFRRFGSSSKYTGATPCFWHRRKYSPLVMVLIIAMPNSTTSGARGLGEVGGHQGLHTPHEPQVLSVWSMRTLMLVAVARPIIVGRKACVLDLRLQMIPEPRDVMTAQFRLKRRAAPVMLYCVLQV